MQGMIISNPRLEFLRPVLERWFDCIDRYNAVRGDSDTPYYAAPCRTASTRLTRQTSGCIRSNLVTDSTARMAELVDALA